MSMIEQLICDKNFSYLEPYFYNNPYALRCELGVGEEEQWLVNAKRRALEIYNLLFQNGADAIIFNYWMYDYSDTDKAQEDDIAVSGYGVEEYARCLAEKEAEQLQFLIEYQAKYRHVAVKGVTTYEDDESEMEKTRRNRIICYSDGSEGFDYKALIDRQVNGKGYEIGFVSFENECIMSVYDDRGCDIVFADKDKMKALYSELKPYFLEYDLAEMERRFRE